MKEYKSGISIITNISIIANMSIIANISRIESTSRMANKQSIVNNRLDEGNFKLFILLSHFVSREYVSTRYTNHYQL